MTKDDFRDAELFGDTWTPPHGTQKRALRRQARSRLRRWTRNLIDKVLAIPSLGERRSHTEWTEDDERAR